ncbi:MAG: DNA cytosine methyltransferase [Candidatus Dadabacteria bacterium]|nr:MAG: DNA cytosine methyltransferase [Candidatus Dadabacteria bacterium]
MAADIPVIDLFAGAGGLGEGFAETAPYRLALSVEMNAAACDTLRIRSIYRRLRDAGEIDVYRQWLLSADGRPVPAGLFERAPAAARDADQEVLCHQLGKDSDEELIGRIHGAINGRDSWVLVGGPPCQAYSVIGRSRNKGIADYRPEQDERNFLYQEYLKILAELAPPVFVMENVKGMLSARVNGSNVFEQIVRDLEAPAQATGRGDGPRYQLHALSRAEALFPAAGDFVVRAEDHGLPQARHRVIIVGVRADVGVRPAILERGGSMGVQKALRGLPRLRSRLSREDSFEAWHQSVVAGLGELVRREAGHLRGLPKGEELLSQLRKIRGEIRKDPPKDHGADVMEISGAADGEPAPDWAVGVVDGLVLQHQSRSHMPSDLIRYVYAATFAKVIERSPKLHEFPESIQPAHKNRSSGHFSDRFRVQLRYGPSTTITSHMSKDGHYYIHFDPVQCRSLTVREAARLQTFPDDYFFAGNRTEQYRQVGNAVPPILGRLVAEAVCPTLCK